jgi:hypothetical protein
LVPGGTLGVGGACAAFSSVSSTAPGTVSMISPAPLVTNAGSVPSALATGMPVIPLGSAMSGTQTAAAPPSSTGFAAPGGLAVAGGTATTPAVTATGSAAPGGLAAAAIVSPVTGTATSTPVVNMATSQAPGAFSAANRMPGRSGPLPVPVADGSLGSAPRRSKSSLDLPDFCDQES